MSFERTLVKNLKDNDSVVRLVSAEILGELQVKEAFVIEALVKALQDNEWDIRQAVARALGELQVKEAFVIKALVKALKDNDGGVRKLAAQALGKLQVKDDFVIKALVYALQDFDSGVRKAAAQALDKLQIKESFVIEALVEALQDNNRYVVRKTAAEALGEHLKLTEAPVMQALVNIALKNNEVEILYTAVDILMNYSNSLTPEVFLKQKLLNSINSIQQENKFSSQTKNESSSSIEFQLLEGKSEPLEKMENITKIPLVNRQDSENILLLQEPIEPIILSSELLELPINTWHISNSDLQFELYPVNDNENYGYRVFGINREETYQLLVNNIVAITPILEKGIAEALFTESFIHYLQENNVASQSLIDAFHYYQQESSQGGNTDIAIPLLLLQKQALQLNVVLNYINYEVRDKKINAEGSHPAILQALAHIQNSELYLWQPANNQVLKPHNVYPYYSPRKPIQRIDLLFINGHHFEQLIRRDIAEDPEENIITINHNQQTLINRLSIFSLPSISDSDESNQQTGKHSPMNKSKP
ncbi:MAG: hypothetical protein LEGION0398_MBIBDBAK_00586 [Legionellaceae bacterium]